jgi:hypothetical protein
MARPLSQKEHQSTRFYRIEKKLPGADESSL